MRQFTTGLIAGGIVGAIGAGFALSDKAKMRKLKRDSRRAFNKAGNIISGITDSFR